MIDNNRINVTKSFIPKIQDYSDRISVAFDNKWLTNRGELVINLEEQLSSYLKVDNILLLCNGTLPIQMALKTIENKGEIITTPFSYVATTAAIVWEGFTPVYVDIDPKYWTIDASKIELAITDNTKGILATHVFGNACEIELIDAIAQKYGLKVIYDGAHAFGVNYKGSSIFSYGDFSTCSFHATKLFHTGEGGAIFVNNINKREQVYNYHNFGHNGAEDFHGLGINAKMSELHAAMGLEVLRHIEDIKKGRQKVDEFYRSSITSDQIRFFKTRAEVTSNYAYFPIVLPDEEQLLYLKSELENSNIFPRRYFYPSLNNLPYLDHKVHMPISEKIASTILCLPIYHDLDLKDLKRIVDIVNNVIL